MSSFDDLGIDFESLGLTRKEIEDAIRNAELVKEFVEGLNAKMLAGTLNKDNATDRLDHIFMLGMSSLSTDVAMTLGVNGIVMCSIIGGIMWEKFRVENGLIRGKENDAGLEDLLKDVSI